MSTGNIPHPPLFFFLFKSRSCYTTTLSQTGDGWELLSIESFEIDNRERQRKTAVLNLLLKSPTTWLNSVKSIIPENLQRQTFLNIKILTIITKTSKHKLNKVLWISIAIKIMLSMQERLWITSQNSLKIYIHLTNSLLYSTDHSRTLRFSFGEWPSSILDQYLLANICICALHPYSLWM